MHAELNVRFELSIDEDKTLPLAALAEFVTEQNIESVLLEILVESLDAARVEALCGEKYAHGNGERRYQRAGSKNLFPVIARENCIRQVRPWVMKEPIQIPAHGALLAPHLPLHSRLRSYRTSPALKNT